MRWTAPLVAFTASLHVLAGDLNPAPGPVSPTMKTLDQVEPRTPIGQNDIPLLINQPGSYYLTGNIDATGTGAAITIATDDVSLDLMGFTMDGLPNEIVQGDTAIEIIGAYSGIRITNGVIRDWRLAGVYGEDVADSAFSDLRIEHNGATTAGPGLRADRRCLIERVIANANGGRGIDARSDTLVIACVANENGSDGIAASGGCEITASVANNNGASGFVVGSGSQARGCTAQFNAEHGFNVGFAGIAIDCAAGHNDMHGFRLITESHVVDCRSHFNDGAGVFASGDENRIDGNNCVGNDIGVDVDFGGNLIVRNTVTRSSTADYQIAGGNDAGSIQTSPVGAGPWDNLSY